MIADKEIEEFNFPEREEVRSTPIEIPVEEPAVEPELVPAEPVPFEKPQGDPMPV